MYWERGVPLPRMDADSATADGVPDFLGGAEDGRFYFLKNPRSSK